VDFDETFSPVIKSATIRAVLTIAAARDWPVHQMDVNNDFLHGHLSERVYCQQPTGFVDPHRPDHVCLLDKSLYGLKQAPRAWFGRFTAFLHSIDFVAARSDPSLFVLHQHTGTAYLLLYVDDIVLTTSSSALLQHVQRRLFAEFSMKDLGPLHYFLGITVQRSSLGFFLSQKKYTDELLDRANMISYNTVSTPVDTRSKMSLTVALPSLIPLNIGALSAHFSTSPRRALTWRTLSSRLASTCMIHGSNT
jgi:hypothetical protein